MMTIKKIITFRKKYPQLQEFFANIKNNNIIVIYKKKKCHIQNIAPIFFKLPTPS